MPPRKKEAGSLTGSKRFKAEKEQQKANSLGAKAKSIADAAGTVLSKSTANSQNRAIPPTPTALAPHRQTQTGNGSNGNNLQFNGLNAPRSGNLQNTGDPFGGIALPQYDFGGMIPTDLLNPQIQLQATQEQLNQGLEVYAAGTRAQHLLQAGFKYIEEVGKTKQQYHKAQSSFVKAATEEVKVKQHVVEYDIQNVELSITGEKLNQATERLKQEQIKTTAAQTETNQLIQKIQATEGKRDAEIQRLNAQTNDIIQKYLTDSIKGAA